MKITQTFKTAALVATLSTFGSFAGASTLAVDVVSGGSAVTNSNFTIGWGFDVTSDVTVTSLGFWDEGSDGLAASHEVGLWRDDGTLLATTTVSNASTDVVASVSGFGSWVFESIGALVLTAGSYQVGAVINGSDPFRTFVEEIDTNPLISNFTSGLFAGGNTLQFMDSQEQSEFSLFGPNMQISTATVPVPAAAWFMVMGVGAVGFAGRRRKKA